MCDTVWNELPFAVPTSVWLSGKSVNLPTQQIYRARCMKIRFVVQVTSLQSKMWSQLYGGFFCFFFQNTDKKHPQSSLLKSFWVHNLVYVLSKWLLKNWYTAVEYNSIFNTIWQGESSKFVQIMNSQKTPHILSLQASYGVSFVSFLEKIYCEISRVHCTL